MLGVTATASKKEFERNKSKFNAFLRVSRPVPPQPLDFPKWLGDIDRNLDTISNAESEISIPTGQLANGMFWFVRMSSLDDECFQHISEGDMEGAVDKWKAAGTVSSLQNMLICRLIRGRLKEAVLLAQNLYTVHFDKWKEMYSILGYFSPVEVSHLFLDRLYLEDPHEISSLNWEGVSGEWESYIKNKSIYPLVNKITALVERCRNSNVGNPKLRYKAGLDLLDKAQPILKELERLLKHDDITLVAIEDKVCTEALNCSIASYNAAYYGLNQGHDAPYREIAPECYKLINRFNSNFLSPTVAKRIEDNKKIIKEGCRNMENIIEEHLASNGDICWFCGSHVDTHEFNKAFSYSVSTPSYLGTQTTTYTKTVKLFICDECHNELKEQKNWKCYAAGAAFIILALIFLLAFDIWFDFRFIGWVITIGIIGIISHYAGKLTGNWMRKTLDKKNIREFKRNIDDHPVVKMIKAEGYN